MDDFRPTAPLSHLVQRGRILQKMRAFFDARGFLEVQTPLLSRDTVIDRHIEPWEVRSSSLAGWGFESQCAYLQTSPEFAMKRLLASGLQAIYQIGPVFRGEERGNLHNPEFTMAEWYRVGDDMEAGIVLLSDLVQEMLSEVLGELPRGQQTERIRYAEAMQRWVGIDSLEASISDLAELAVEHRLVSSVDWSDDWDDWVNLLFSELVQPRLGEEGPVVITHFPASQSALARLDPVDPRVAERFEIFVRGIELANGYHELTDADELRRRNEQVQLQRLRDGKRPLPLESRLLSAMESGIPPTAGCALGFDRLVMLACRAKCIEEVLTFPIERA